MAKDTNKDLLTVGEVAQSFNVDSTTVRRWIRNGALEAVALPSLSGRTMYRIRRVDIESLLDK